MFNESDGLGMAPRIGEPESALLPGMAVVAPGGPVGAFSGPGLGLLASIPDTSQSGPGSIQEPIPWTYDFNPATGSARATFSGEVTFTTGGAVTAGVTSWNGRAGVVTLLAADITGAGGAPLASPAFTGSPVAPTPAPGDATTKLATTSFVALAIAADPDVASWNGRIDAVVMTTGDIITAGGAPVDSPALTGTPTAPTPALGNQSSLVATTQFVASAIASGIVSWNGRTGAVTLSLSDVQSVGGAPLVSPNFTGTPSAPTPTGGDATTRLATTAFVANAVTAAASGVASFNTRTGAVVLLLSDIIAVGGAPLLSPNFTGTPTAPTPTGGDSTTKVATTAFVASAIAGAALVTAWNGRTGAVTLTTADITTAGGAALASPTFTGDPKAPTAAPGDNDTSIATTAFVAALGALKANLASPTFTGSPVVPGYAPLASPALTGTPTVPTAAPGTNTTQAASTAFVQAQIAASAITVIMPPRVITASGTYSPTAGMQFCVVECVGGGGGGGGMANSAAGNQGGGAGGGGGGYARSILTAAQIAAQSPVPVTIGTGGAGGTAAGGAGGNGNPTIFGSPALCQGGNAAGGLPGVAGSNTAQGGQGGSSSVGDLIINGQDGDSGWQAAIVTIGMTAGNGGNAAMGFGAGGQGLRANIGQPGNNYGGGGSGGHSVVASGARAGGAGAPGVCIITEFI